MRRFPVFIAVLMFAVLAWTPGVRAADATQTALFAGGNFWAMQYVFAQVPGVTNTVAGYAGGILVNPTYAQVAKGDTGHRLGVLVTYDPKKVTYEKLLALYWRNIDPVDGGGQFCDRGPQYTTAIFYADETQRHAAQDSKMLLEADSTRMAEKPAATIIMKAGSFYPAESHHQSYYSKNPLRFRFFMSRCGREARLKDFWGKGPER